MCKTVFQCWNKVQSIQLFAYSFKEVSLKPISLKGKQMNIVDIIRQLIEDGHQDMADALNSGEVEIDMATLVKGFEDGDFFDAIRGTATLKNLLKFSSLPVSQENREWLVKNFGECPPHVFEVWPDLIVHEYFGARYEVHPTR